MSERLVSGYWAGSFCYGNPNCSHEWGITFTSTAENGGATFIRRQCKKCPEMETTPVTDANVGVLIARPIMSEIGRLQAIEQAARAVVNEPSDDTVEALRAALDQREGK